MPRDVASGDIEIRFRVGGEPADDERDIAAPKGSVDRLDKLDVRRRRRSWWWRSSVRRLFSCAIRRLSLGAAAIYKRTGLADRQNCSTLLGISATMVNWDNFRIPLAVHKAGAVSAAARRSG